MSMYPVGCKVVHPFYGAGTICHIQEKRIGEQQHSYYVILTICKSMQLMVPVQGAQSLGLRTVGEATGLRQALSDCRAAPVPEFEKDLHLRQAGMREGLKSGSYERVAGVVRQLYLMCAQRTLGTVDRQLLDQGKDLLASELAVASDLGLDQAKQEVESCLTAIFEAAGENAVQG
jgi:RNA polymerase-interacting CarD/CdnL/TRCF family regulator